MRHRERMLRQSTQPDRARLVEARCRQEVLRTVKQAPSSVADRPCRALIERCVERKDAREIVPPDMRHRVVPYQDQRMLRQSTQPDRARLVEARCRQEVLRTVKQFQDKNPLSRLRRQISQA
jgi:hypothetical protein